MDQLNNSVIREPAGGDVNMRETERRGRGRGAAGERGAREGARWARRVEGRGRGRDVTAPRPQSASSRRSGRSRHRRLLYTRKYDKNRQNFRPAVPLTFQGVEIGGRPVGVMCDVLAGQDEVRRRADGAAGLLPGALQPHVPQLRPAALRAQPVREYHSIPPPTRRYRLGAGQACGLGYRRVSCYC